MHVYSVGGLLPVVGASQLYTWGPPGPEDPPVQVTAGFGGRY